MSTTAGPVVGWRELLRQGAHLVRASDLAMAYGGLVVAVAVVLQLAPESVHHDVVLRSSTNLVNLREHPFSVLLVSAFVVSHIAGLWIVPWLMVCYAAGQRWLGRSATVFAAFLGHFTATLAVGVLLFTGIWHGWVPRAVADDPDVGVSYGLACLSGLLILQVPRRWRGWYALANVVFWVGPLIVSPNFTDVGHAIAIALGGGLALLVSRAARARAWTDAPGTS